MAIKSKNISPLIKVFCVLLSAVLFALSFLPLPGILIRSFHYAYSGEELLHTKEWTWVFHCHEQLNDDIKTIMFAAAGKQQFNSYLEEFQYNAEEDYYVASNGTNDEIFFFAGKKEYEQIANGLQSVRFYAYNRQTGKVLSNLGKDVDYKSIASLPYSLIWDGTNYSGSEQMSDLPLPAPVSGSYTPDFVKDIRLYLYLDTEGHNDAYALTRERFERINTVYPTEGVSAKLITSALCATAAIVLLIVSACYAGNRDAKGKLQLVFIDYLPVDVHFVLSGGAIAGCVAGMIAGCEELSSIFLNYDSLQSLQNGAALINFLFSFLAGLAWLLLAEYLFSLVRVCKAKRQPHKAAFLLLLPYLLWKLLVKVFRKIKAFFAFNVKYVGKHIRSLAIGYSAVNLFFFIALAVSAVAQDGAVPLFVLLLLLAFNGVCAALVLRYLYYLDNIIAAAVSGSALPIDFMKLPVSLRYLASSLQGNRENLDRAVANALKSERMKTDLITNVSHDLKTPLTSIITYIELLKQCEITDETQKEYIEIIDEKGKRLKVLIEDLIEASKVTSGVISIQPVRLSLSELAAQAVGENEDAFENAGLKLQLASGETETFVTADGAKTYRVLQNLLSNALKYSASGSRVYCNVCPIKGGGMFEIKNVSAEALNISADELKERFVRGDRSRARDGNGLGLSIAESLCKAQGGRLDLSIDGDLFKAKVILPN